MFISCRSYDLQCKDPSRRFDLTLVVSPSVLPTPPTGRNVSMSMRDEGDGVVDHTCIACSIRDPSDSLSEGWIMSRVSFMSEIVSTYCRSRRLKILCSGLTWRW